MKNTIFLAIAALLFTLSVNAQSTVDSIKAKYQLQAMPAPLTMEKTFPAIGTYQLTEAGTASTITITLDEQNKGMIWVEGLPQGKIKAFLKKSPSTYRILSQKTEGGKQIPEGTLIFDEATSTLSIALGMPYDETNPASVFTLSSYSSNTAKEVKIKDDKFKVDEEKVKEEDITKGKDAKSVSVKKKTNTGKVKTKVTFYTATKVTTGSDANNMMNTTTQPDSTNMQQGNVSQPVNPGQPTSPNQSGQPGNQPAQPNPANPNQQ